MTCKFWRLQVDSFRDINAVIMLGNQKYIHPQEVHFDQTLPIGSRESFAVHHPEKTFLVLDLQGIHKSILSWWILRRCYVWIFAVTSHRSGARLRFRTFWYSSSGLPRRYQVGKLLGKGDGHGLLEQKFTPQIFGSDKWLVFMLFMVSLW